VLAKASTMLKIGASAPHSEAQCRSQRLRTQAIRQLGQGIAQALKSALRGLGVRWQGML
jgi:hypothetical protein